jgi:ABC-type branched-subunit amino acid transport system substrate-binding protein
MRTMSSVMMRIVRGRPGLRRWLKFELLGDQLPVPAQQRIGRDDRAQFEQNLAWDAKRFTRQHRPFSIQEAKRAPLKALAQHAVLGLQILNNNELLTADPTGEDKDDESQRRRLQIHPQSLACRARSCLCSSPKASTKYLDTTAPAAIYNPKRSWAGDPIKVGIATDLTGAISNAGIPNANVAKMVVDDINANGGLLKRPLQIVLEDTASNEQLAVTRVRKLVTQDKVDVVFGGITSSMRNAIKGTIVNRGKTLYIYPNLYEGKECTPFLFCTGPTPAQQCDTFIPWLITNGGKRFYLSSADYVWPHVLNAYARKLIESNGGEVVGEEYFPVDQNEYGPTVNKIMSSKVNVVFNTTIPPGVSAFFKQLYDAGFIANRIKLRLLRTTQSDPKEQWRVSAQTTC